MKLSIEYDLKRDVVRLETPFSHREFTARRALNCKDCGCVNRNPLVEVLRAIAIYELEPKDRDVSRAILAYDLEEILSRMEVLPKVTFCKERGRSRPDGVVIRTIPRKVSFEELGDLDDL